jgi:hypothetical protein
MQSYSGRFDQSVIVISPSHGMSTDFGRPELPIRTKCVPHLTLTESGVCPMTRSSTKIRRPGAAPVVLSHPIALALALALVLGARAEASAAAEASGAAEAAGAADADVAADAEVVADADPKSEAGPEAVPDAKADADPEPEAGAGAGAGESVTCWDQRAMAVRPTWIHRLTRARSAFTAVQPCVWKRYAYAPAPIASRNTNTPSFIRGRFSSFASRTSDSFERSLGTLARAASIASAAGGPAFGLPRATPLSAAAEATPTGAGAASVADPTATISVG